MKASCEVSHFWLFKNADEFANPLSAAIFCPCRIICARYVGNAKIIKQDLENILHFTKDLNDWLHELKVKEAIIAAC